MYLLKVIEVGIIISFCIRYAQAFRYIFMHRFSCMYNIIIIFYILNFFLQKYFFVFYYTGKTTRNNGPERKSVLSSETDQKRSQRIAEFNGYRMATCFSPFY